MDPRSFKKPRVPEVLVDTTDSLSNAFAKWAPLICAGSAIGLSIFVLREMKKTKLELTKKETPDVLNQKMERMERQLKTITEYLKQDNKVVKSVKVEEIPEKVNIINVKPEKVKEEVDSEYEEVEVTDSETED
jgi:hypothetical protein